MKNLRKSIPIAIFCLSILSCTNNNENWEVLMTPGSFQGWDKYLSKPHKSMDIPELKKLDSGEFSDVLGVNNDPLKVFDFVQMENEKVLRISGQVFGLLISKNEFENFHLKTKFKWGQDKHAPRDKGKRDSGILFHGFGEPGCVNSFWINSQEFQIQERDLGDYWAVGNTSMNIPAEEINDGNYYYSENSGKRTFSNQADRIMRRCLKGIDAEKEHGEWNDLDLICLGDSAVFVVNGTVVLRGYDSRRIIDGASEKLTKGKISIQSEGAEVFFKDLKIRSISQIPSEFCGIK